jgi:hypothetical protein
MCQTVHQVVRSLFCPSEVPTAHCPLLTVPVSPCGYNDSMEPGNGAERKAHAARRTHCLCGWRLWRVPVKVSTVTTDVAVGASYRRPPLEFFFAHFSLWLHREYRGLAATAATQRQLHRQTV